MATINPVEASNSEVKAAIKSTSPLAGYYETWNSLSEFDASSPKGLLAIIKRLAELSKDEFFYAAVPVPGPAEKELRELLSEDVSCKKYDELGMRRQILRQFKFYLRNQTKNCKKVHKEAYQYWKDAKQKFESEVSWANKGKMSLTTYRPQIIDAIFDAATKACACTWDQYRKKMTKMPKPQDIESRVARFACDGRFANRPDIVDAFRATLNADPFTYSAYAQRLGVKCDQKNGILTIGSSRLNIPSTSELAWTVIRLFVSSKDPKGVTILYDRWDGTFAKASKNNDKSDFRQRFVQSTNACKRQNNKSFRIVDPQKISP